MTTPILDFVRAYAAGSSVRAHMPGHKGVPRLGCEPFDITEIAGADALYEADGIIAKSEEHATALFGTNRTLYSTEGSSQCIRAMLFLAATRKKSPGRARILAGRNAHKAFLYAAALLDLDVEWLWPSVMPSLFSCFSLKTEFLLLFCPGFCAIFSDNLFEKCKKICYNKR